MSRGEHPPHRESLGKVPRCHCSQMAAGSPGSLPRWEGADPAGAPTLLLPPYICTETQEQGQSVAAQPMHGRGLSAATSPPTPVALLRAVISGDTLLPPSKLCSWDSRGRDQQVPAVPRHGTNMEPGGCRAPPLAATSSTPQRWGWPWQRWDKVAKPDTAAERAGGSCWVLDGCFGVLCQGAPGVGCSRWAGGRWGPLAQPGARGEGHGQGWYLHLSWGDCADTFSTCGQRAVGPEESNSWGDPVSGPAPGDAADTEHQRARNSKASLVGCPSHTQPKGLPALPHSAPEHGGASRRWGPMWG